MRIKDKVVFLIIAYFVVGIIYTVGFGLSNGGNLLDTNIFWWLVFGPWMILFWPMAVYGDLKNHGVMIQDVFALVAVLVSILIFVKRYRKRRG